MPRPPHIFGSRRGEVGHQAVASVLVGIGALGLVIELVDWQVDKGREIAVVNRVRIGLVGGQVEILDPLDSRQRSAVVDRIRHIVVIVLESATQRLQA